MSSVSFDPERLTTCDQRSLTRNRFPRTTGYTVSATPAILDGRIYIRASGELICLGKP
jgi:hypothetical protein